MDDTQRIFGGLQRLYGVQGAANICAAHVAVVGIGGVGSWAAEALARSGVGRITLIDFDQVSLSNINRQIHADSTTVGMAKVDAMAKRIQTINPNCVVQRVEAFATPENWAAMVAQASSDGAGGFSAVVDACDQSKTKLALAVWARGQLGCLFITSGAAGGKRQAHRVDIADLAEVTHDPLLASLRYRLRREYAAPAGKALGVACVYSQEAVTPPDASCALPEQDAAGDGSLNCHGYGSAVSVTASFGMCAAGWVLDGLARRAGAGVPSKAVAAKVSL